MKSPDNPLPEVMLPIVPVLRPVATLPVSADVMDQLADMAGMKLQGMWTGVVGGLCLTLHRNFTIFGHFGPFPDMFHTKTFISRSVSCLFLLKLSFPDLFHSKTFISRSVSCLFLLKLPFLDLFHAYSF
jgi:hypothetical protein